MIQDETTCQINRTTKAKKIKKKQSLSWDDIHHPQVDHADCWLGRDSGMSSRVTRKGPILVVGHFALSNTIDRGKVYENSRNIIQEYYRRA